ncbi:PERM1 protein, partial [Pardalotus punctatus]|nr:PERM1 protein [Pardalotus punctatus]
MDNFEYSIQLNDREWAEFFQASEECSLAPASLATAEEQCLSDIEQGDASGRECPCGPGQLTAAGAGSEPAAGTGSRAPRGVPGDSGDTAGHRPELLSGSEDEAEPGSAGRFLCDSEQPGALSPSAMPSAQRRQPPRPPPAGGTAQGSPGPDTAAEKGAAGGSRTPEPPGPPEQGGDAGGGQAHGSAVVAQPAEVAQAEVPAASPEGPAGKSSASASPAEPRLRGAAGNPPSPSLGTAARVVPEEGTEPSSPGGSPGVVRPKVPAQPRKSRRQRGAGGTEGDKDPAGAAAPAAAGAGKATPGSPMSSRKGKGKEKAAKGALVRLGSEEAAESKRSVPGPGVDGGDPGTAPPKQRGKEPGAQSPGKTKATKLPKAGQAGALGVRDSVPVVPGDGAEAPPGEPCQEMPGKPLQPSSAAAFGGNAAAAEIPRAMSPLCSADGASANPNSLDVTWPEMYDYLFCDSQEEEELVSSLEGRKSPLQREFSWPELYEYFFNEPEGNRKKGKAKERKRKKFSSLDRTGLSKEDPSSAPGKDTVFIPVPDVYGHFFPERARNRMGWRGIFSVAPASEVKKAVRALKSLLQRQIHGGGGQTPTSQALVPRGSGEKLALVPLAGAQVWPEDAATALALRGKCCSPL